MIDANEGKIAFIRLPARASLELMQLRKREKEQSGAEKKLSG
jgi:hypothetical protein